MGKSAKYRLKVPEGAKLRPSSSTFSSRKNDGSLTDSSSLFEPSSSSSNRGFSTAHDISEPAPMLVTTTDESPSSTEGSSRTSSKARRIAFLDGLLKPTKTIQRKKLKRKLKHDEFIKKLEGVHKELEKEKTKVTAEGTISNLNSITDILPSLSAVLETNAQSKKKKHPILTSKNKNKLLSAELEQFKNVLAHPAFKANPMGAITEHLKNTIKLQESEKKKEKSRAASDEKLAKQLQEASSISSSSSSVYLSDQKVRSAPPQGLHQKRGGMGKYKPQQRGRRR